MFVLLLAYAITQSIPGEAIPTPFIESRDPIGRDESIQTRTLWNILWSCLSTIFLCTWVSLHPNISSTQENTRLGWFKKQLWNPLIGFLTYKLPLFLWALLVPEYILAWAIRQFFMAGKIQKQVPGWTRTHGFFLIMGGFQLFQSNERRGLALQKNQPGTGKFVRILSLDDAHQHPLNTIVPFTTEEELKDRGKSDLIAKVIVLIQTSWFIIQCVARRLELLPLTELEVVTLAYATMNFFIYIFWWDKPRNVGCPIRVYKDLWTWHRQPKVGWNGGCLAIFERITGYVIGAQDEFVLLSKERKVPMFWSGMLTDTYDTTPFHAALVPSILGMAFGALHFIAWSYEFPSHVEITLWRVACVVMVAVPMVSAVVCGFIMNGISHQLLAVMRVLFNILLALSTWLYIVARIATIVIAFTTLRSLSSQAFRVVDWTTFIPHI